MNTQQVYRYAGASQLTAGRLRLSASGGAGQLFAGWLTHAAQSARALLSVARVAGTRYYLPPSMLAAQLARDPVVTCNGDLLRFESFSSCGGVYARYDVLPGGLDGTAFASGSTNVDVNPPLRSALQQVTDGDPLWLDVGTDSLTVTTNGVAVVEKAVPLPVRWLKGFGEVQVAASEMDPRADCGVVEARRFLQSLPARGSVRRPLWVVPSGRGLRLVTRPVPGAACLSGPERLEALGPLLPHASGLRAYSSPAGDTPSQASAWELSLASGRFVLVLSPDVSRGFSGEGGVLAAAASEQTGADADALAALLRWDAPADAAALADAAGLPLPRVRAALRYLAAAGLLGYDLAEAASFRRELPYDLSAIRALHPRAVAARALAAAGAVIPDRPEPGQFTVRAGQSEYHVRLAASAGGVCTCPWWSRHRGVRGPCKHVLAAALIQSGEIA